MELNIQTVLIIVLVVVGLFWLKSNQPETYNTITGILKDIWDGIVGLFKNNKTDTNGTVENGTVNYGEPYVPQACQTDADCQAYYNDVPGIKCNNATGECYAEV